MEAMLDLACRENIIVEEFYLDPPLKGLYICQEARPPLIGLSTLIDGLAEKRSVLAEELGHHFTTTGDCLPRQFFNYSHRMTINKAEYKALRWAANYLISDNALINVLREGLYQPCELAEHFCVVPEIINMRLKLFKNSANILRRKK